MSLARAFGSHDPFDVPASIVPPGMSYQWCAKTILGEPNPSWQRMVDAGWWPVPGKRHPGMWKVNADGDVEIGGQMLMWRMDFETAAAQQRELDKVAKQMDDWARRAGAAGLSGGVRMQAQAGSGTQSGVSGIFERPIGNVAFMQKQQQQAIDRAVLSLSCGPPSAPVRKSLLSRLLAWFKKDSSK